MNSNRGDSFMFTVTGTTSAYCVLGNPVAHSMSPLMHNTAFRHLGMDAIYLPFEVDDLPAAVSGLKALNIKGASVTHPFKEAIIELVDEIDDTAKKIGAINTLVFTKGGILGTNTDWVGLVKTIETLLPISDHTFVVLGAGGAARAAVFGIISHGGKAIVANRSEKKGRLLADEFDMPFVSLSKLENVQAACLINATPVGMYPQEDDTPVPTQILTRYKAVVDVIYNPVQTKLLKEAQSQGCMTASGFEMFVHQGIEQFRIWTDTTPPAKEMRNVVYQRLMNK